MQSALSNPTARLTIGQRYHLYIDHQEATPLAVLFIDGDPEDLTNDQYPVPDSENSETVFSVGANKAKSLTFFAPASGFKFSTGLGSGTNYSLSPIH